MNNEQLGNDGQGIGRRHLFRRRYIDNFTIKDFPTAAAAGHQQQEDSGGSSSSSAFSNSNGLASAPRPFESVVKVRGVGADCEDRWVLVQLQEEEEEAVNKVQQMVDYVRGQMNLAEGKHEVIVKYLVKNVEIWAEVGMGVRLVRDGQYEIIVAVKQEVAEEEENKRNEEDKLKGTLDQMGRQMKEKDAVIGQLKGDLEEWKRKIREMEQNLKAVKVEEETKKAVFHEINKVDDYGQTQLHLAVQDGDVGRVKMLVENGANVEARDDYSFRPLHNAAMEGKTQIVKILLKSGARFDAITSDNDNPLHWAAENAHYDVVELLLEHSMGEYGKEGTKAFMNSRDKHGGSALHAAYRGGDMDVVKLILEHGANTNIRTEDGYFPAQMRS